MVSDVPLLLHAWTDLKFILPDCVCMKGLPLAKKKPMDISTFWWFLDMRRVKGILRMLLWCSGILMIDLSCMMGIWGPYMTSDLLM